MSFPDPPDPVVRFGEFTASLETGEIDRNGTKIKLQVQPFQVLFLLLKYPGRLVTREELRRQRPGRLPFQVVHQHVKGF